MCRKEDVIHGPAVPEGAVQDAVAESHRNHAREGGPTKQQCCVQHRAGFWWVKWECIERAMLSSWHPGSVSPSGLFHSSQQHPRAPAGPTSCICMKRCVCASREACREGWQECETNTGGQWLYPQFSYLVSFWRPFYFWCIFIFSKTLLQSLWRDSRQTEIK